MRMLMTVTMEVEAGNRAIKDGSLPKIFEKFLQDRKPESSYFTTGGGDRQALFVLDISDVTDMPSIAEPFFLGLNAKVELKPVMNAQEMHAGVQKAMSR